MTTFKDHFSTQAPAYARHRPRYPSALFDYLAEVAPARLRCWDCATGNGQAAVALAEHFDDVVATDASAQQLEQCISAPRVTYRRALAEQSELADDSVDLVTVAAAIHWFDRDLFYREVRRVCRAGGVLAAWVYGARVRVSPGVDAAVAHFANEVLAPFWPAEFHHTRTGYRELDFPFEQLDAPSFEAQQQWGLEQILGFARTWSATPRYVEKVGDDPIALLRQRLEPTWHDEVGRDTATVGFPLHVLIGRT